MQTVEPLSTIETIEPPSEPVDPQTASLERPPPAKKYAQPMASPEVRTLPDFKRREANFQDCYDTDGEGPPVYNMEAEEFEEEALTDVAAEAESAIVEPVYNLEPTFLAISPADVDRLTIPKLKHELMIRAVQYSSMLKKPELKERLLLALESGVKVTIFGDPSKKKKAKGKASVTDLTGFDPGSFWQPLVPNKVAVTEPVNSIVNVYVYYKKVMEEAGVPKKDWLSHLQIQEGYRFGLGTI